MTAGYSGKPLATKLGITKGTTVLVLGAPDHLQRLLDPLPPAVRIKTRVGAADMAICFATHADDLWRRVAMALPRLPPSARIWAAWPKKASKVPTDLDENRCRELFLPVGLVDVKVCAIDETWSGLALVVRKHLRDRWNPEIG